MNLKKFQELAKKEQWQANSDLIVVSNTIPEMCPAQWRGNKTVLEKHIKDMDKLVEVYEMENAKVPS